MKRTLSYVLVTPYTIAKNRIGGILARLISQTGLELAGCQMIAADEELTRAYAEQLRKRNASNDTTLLADYVEQNLGPSGGQKHRSLLLLFRGEAPCDKLAAVIGSLCPERRELNEVAGETIRDTYADLITDKADPKKVVYFEPAALTPWEQEWADKDLALFSRFLKNQENIVNNRPKGDSTQIEQTLVILKPDNWQYASSKPGAVIDMFSRTGARIVGLKVHRFSLAEALEFYGPVEGVLREKLAPIFGGKARKLLEKEFGVELDDTLERSLSETFGVRYARDQFDQIIKFMSGIQREECPPEKANDPGDVKCMILIYEGENVIQKIRDVLGPTDPLKAPGGTVRREFGSNVMVNTAHASDSAESMEREKKIVKIDQNPLGGIIDSYLAKQKQEADEQG
ncbi:MAG: nucleoside-diphosphate kinase [Treponema sp.]|jgi:nucleoside diphosphate kinase|nr:nucleoside-diphosphate kinase [Treponema sp.]